MECPYCKSKKLEKDYIHAELVCKECGLVLECPPIWSNGKPAVRYCYH